MKEGQDGEEQVRMNAVRLNTGAHLALHACCARLALFCCRRMLTSQTGYSLTSRSSSLGLLTACMSIKPLQATCCQPSGWGCIAPRLEASATTHACQRCGWGTDTSTRRRRVNAEVAGMEGVARSLCCAVRRQRGKGSWWRRADAQLDGSICHTGPEGGAQRLGDSRCLLLNSCVHPCPAHWQVYGNEQDVGR